ncbi:MAG: hypothetical protein GY726_08015 [Proteobacteria bacterium]|nr:hypothetical protein [Pseudomonadota bacterium]
MTIPVGWNWGVSSYMGNTLVGENWLPTTNTLAYDGKLVPIYWSAEHADFALHAQWSASESG